MDRARTNARLPIASHHAKPYVCLIATALLSASIAAHAVEVPDEYDQRIKQRREIAALGSGLFGDRIDPSVGQLEIVQTDVDLPGNNALPVRVGRRFVVGSGVYSVGHFRRFNLDIPHAHGVFPRLGSAGQWPVDANSQDQYKRCSLFGPPPTVVYQGGFFSPDEYWHGSFFYLPGAGEQELLQPGANRHVPSGAGPYPIVTKQGTAVRCVPLAATSVSGSQGEGFEVITADGVTYTLNHMVTRTQANLTRTSPMPYVVVGDPSARNSARNDARNSTPQARVPAPAPDVAVNYNLPRQEVILYPTRVTDRHGNAVTYSWSSSNPWQLLGITSSDGRSLSLSYPDSRSREVSSVSDGTRTWTYAYSTTDTVTQPDGSTWRYDLDGLFRFRPTASGDKCDAVATQSGSTTGSLTAPTGATAAFTVTGLVMGRSWAYRDCAMDEAGTPLYARDPYLVPVAALTAKTITGPGLPNAGWTWTYSYGASNHCWHPAGAASGVVCTSSSPPTRTITVNAPEGATRYTYGNRFRVNEGLLLKTEILDGTAVLRTTDVAYADPDAAPYGAYNGTSIRSGGDVDITSKARPQAQVSATQQGHSFNWQVTALDPYARPTSITRSSSTGYSRSETTAYADNTALWVLGQVQSISASGQTPVLNTYDAAARLLSTTEFGLLRSSYTWNTDGTLRTQADGTGNTTTYADWSRGIPRTTTHPDGTTQTASVDARGWITALTDENGISTGYGYDAMGRLTSLSPPSPWNATTQAFEQVGGTEYDLAAGHWRQTVSTGNARKVTYFDGLWRPVLTRRFDAADEANTRSMVLRVFDSAGRTRFTSYPQRAISGVTAQPYGQATSYDALGRPLQTLQDSEQGWLATNYAYQAGLQTAVTNPRGFTTTTAYGAFDDPDSTFATAITAPEGVSVSISRDVWAKPLAITRSGGGKSATRSHVYDSTQQLCKTTEPESGATLVDYDAAGNVAWKAVGTALTGNSCDRASAPAARKINYSYDSRNRLTGTVYGDGSPSITRSYTPDGLLGQITSAKPGTNTISWAYSYNTRRLLSNERYQWGDPNAWWDFSWGIDANGNVSSLTDPWGSMGYAPNALGQPTQVSGFASGVSYHPNGAVAGYMLANGVSHSTALNMRGLPQRITHTGIAQDAYSYDANGNITAINDEQEGVNNRSMPSYDGLDRLRQANGPWGAGSFDYDALDNLTASTVGGRTLSHNMDAATNRLASLTGSQSIGIGYDANGNVSQRGAQSFAFDIGNRMASAPGKASYLYDGHGRRNLVFFADGGWMHQAYTQDGKLRFGWRNTEGGTRYVYLGDKLIAEHTEGGVKTFAHTDALGSPVAKTNASGAVVSRTRYEPYGATVAGSTNPTKIGFTGHVNDPDTGLVYMQQRYYDPIAGRFLSVDPVTTDATTGDSFNRYVYGHNNPYKYTDPDGRFANFVFGALIGGGIELGFQLADGKGVNWTSVGVAAGVGAITGGMGGIAAQAATRGAITAGQAVAATAAIGGEAAAVGKVTEAALTGKPTTTKEVAASALGGAAGSAVGGKLATKMIGAAEKVAASANNVVSGVGKATLGAIREGGSPGAVTTGASELTQKAADVAAGVGGKKFEEVAK